MVDTLTAHDTHVKCIVHYRCIIVLHRLLRFPFFKLRLGCLAQGREPLVEVGLSGDEGQAALRTQACGRGITDRWRGSFVAGLTTRFRRGRGEVCEERQLGGIILREVALEPVADAGDKTGGLKGGTGFNRERQHQGAVGVVEQREVFDGLEAGRLRVQGGHSPIALGLEQVASVHGGCVTDISSPRWILAPTEPALKMALILKLKAVHESLPC